MLKYTRSVLGDTIDAIKGLARGIEITVQLVYIAYLIISIALGNGILLANIVLLIVSVSYFIYDMASAREFYTKKLQKQRENVKKTVKITKRVTHIVIIVIACIELATNPFDAVSLIMTFIMIVGFIVSLIFDITISMIEARKELFVNAIALDMKPKKVIDVFHKITGHKPTEEELEEERIREKLEEIYKEQKEKKQRKKLWQRKIKEKEHLKQQKTEEKAKHEKEYESVKWK